jgi:hypothetical protein
VLGDEGLAEIERVDQLTDGALVRAQRIEDVPAMRFAHCGQNGRRHDWSITNPLYACTYMYDRFWESGDGHFSPIRSANP